MSYMLFTHKVADYDAWKIVFDECFEMRREAGEDSAKLFRDDSEPNKVTLMLGYNSLDSAREFAGSARLRTAMEMAGVAEAPQISYLNDA